MLYAHWRDVTDWPYRHFTPQEIACRGTGELLINDTALTALDALREELDGPLTISSAYRSAYHNARVGGALFGQHRLGAAFDCVLAGREKETIVRAARAVGFKGFGLHYRTFVHIDIGKARTW